MGEHDDRVLEALRKVPGFETVEKADAIVRQGGLTNFVFRVDTAGRSVIVRLAGEGTDAYIDRRVEAHNARAAARAGVSPEMLFADPASGLMVTRTIPAITTMTPAGFAAIDGAPARAGRALAKLHASGETFEFRFELFSM
ncbi:MAG: hypothetical protein KDF64_01230, partial [Geminicoccaceae bacterium]|nr:hypothetical protein [Geminicoccaceae bacterium]